VSQVPILIVARHRPDCRATAEIRTGLPWARITHLQGTLKAVRYVAEGRTIVQRMKIASELADLLRKVGIPIPKQLLVVTEAADTPASA
jgi:hypothetical protein